jgi:hypothetical protein
MVERKPAKKGPIPLPEWNKQTVIAFQALQAGVANDGQQKSCLDWILYEAARIRDMTFDPNSTRLSDFAEGRRFVGLQLGKLLALKVGMLKD